jgi:hypothetical protein
MRLNKLLKLKNRMWQSYPISMGELSTKDPIFKDQDPRTKKAPIIKYQPE